jgi:hypothetical protein
MTCRTQTAPPKRYLIGNLITVRATLTDADGAVVDPANLRMLVAGPSDTVSTVVSMDEDEDVAVGSFTPDEAGVWAYRVETFAGTVEAAVERTVIVVASIVPPTA